MITPATCGEAPRTARPALVHGVGVGDRDARAGQPAGGAALLPAGPAHHHEPSGLRLVEGDDRSAHVRGMQVHRAMSSESARRRPARRAFQRARSRAPATSSTWKIACSRRRRRGARGSARPPCRRAPARPPRGTCRRARTRRCAGRSSRSRGRRTARPGAARRPAARRPPRGRPPRARPGAAGSRRRARGDDHARAAARGERDVAPRDPSRARLGALQLAAAQHRRRARRASRTRRTPRRGSGARRRRTGSRRRSAGALVEEALGPEGERVGVEVRARVGEPDRRRDVGARPAA